MNKQVKDVSNKYALNPDRLEEDIHNIKLEHEACREAIKDIILADPSKMELRYYDAIDALMEIKYKYKL